MARRVALSAILAAILAFVAWSGAYAQGVRAPQAFQLHRGSSTLALVFVHGLGGCTVPPGSTVAAACPSGAVDSFANANGANWLRMVAADQFILAESDLATIFSRPIRLSDLGVWAVNYSDLVGGQCPGHSIYDVARDVRTAIEGSDLFRQYEQVVFVGHSLGGLIIKEVLAAWQSPTTRDGYLGRTIGAFMLGVPARGAPLADRDGITAYLRHALGLDQKVGVCSRIVQDLFRGDENSYLNPLESRWRELLRVRRAGPPQTNSPWTACAHETRPEVRVGSRFELTVVPYLYAETDCLRPSGRIPEGHTRLPKPPDPQAPVHQGWLRPELTALMAAWATWPTEQVSFPPGRGLQWLAEYVEAPPLVLRLELDPRLANFRPRDPSYTAPNRHALVEMIVRRNPELCLETSWPTRERATLTIRPAGSCSSR